MSYYSRLALATGGYRGGTGQTLYISQEFSVEDPDSSLASVIEQTVNLANIITVPLEVVTDVGTTTVVVSDPQEFSISIAPQEITVTT